MKNLLLLLALFASTSLFSQVNSLDYLMKYNCETNQYDVSLVIVDGSALTLPQRAQFNAQISIVVPTGETVSITEMNMPLQNNQNYNGTEPLIWHLGTPIVAPAAQPENDFIGITPTLSPASFYNDLVPGDVVKLFSFIAGSSGQYDENVRFFKNGVDPASNMPGMGGGDFSNNFTMGGSSPIFNETTVESCVTHTETIQPLELNIFPNPFQNQFTIELLTNIRYIQIIDTKGQVHYTSENLSEGILIINANDFAEGIYYTRLVSENGQVSSKRIVKL